jgi:hypothetical protein
MKSLEKLSSHGRMFICILLFFCSKHFFGQEKINLYLGVGLPELTSIGIKYQLYQKQIGLGISISPFPLSEENLFEEKFFSASIDYYSHFAGFSKLSERQPWYGRVGYNLYQEENYRKIQRWHYLNLRIGRDLNISERMGLNLDAGAIIRLLKSTRYKEEYEPNSFINSDFPILPSLGIGIFVRI